MPSRNWPRDAELDKAIESAVRHLCDGGVLVRCMDIARRAIDAPLTRDEKIEVILSAVTDVVTESVEAALVMDRVAHMLMKRQRPELAGV